MQVGEVNKRVVEVEGQIGAEEAGVGEEVVQMGTDHIKQTNRSCAGSRATDRLQPLCLFGVAISIEQEGLGS